jgi:RNA polymerase sigma-B factor
VVTIVGELKKHLRTSGWNVHVPRRVQEDALAVQATIDRLSVELGRSPRLSEVARATHLTIERVSQAIRARTARYAAVELEPDRSGSPTGWFGLGDDLDLRAAVQALPPADRQLISLVFDSDLTQREIASRIDISQSQVQRRLARVLERLHRMLSEVPDRGSD